MRFLDEFEKRMPLPIGNIWHYDFWAIPRRAAQFHTWQGCAVSIESVFKQVAPQFLVTNCNEEGLKLQSDDVTITYKQ
jgi:hypothetical protein